MGNVEYSQKIAFVRNGEELRRFDLNDIAN